MPFSACPSLIATGQDKGYLAIPAIGKPKYTNRMYCKYTITVTEGKVRLLFLNLLNSST